MGLDAYVLCNCLKEGKAKQPPFDATLISFEENNYFPNVLYEGNEELYWLFDQWKESACEHSNFRYVSERISNWNGCSLFLETLKQIGVQYFPILISEWPKANGGEMAPDQAAGSLKELDIFYSKINELEGVFLTDPERMEELFCCVNGQKKNVFLGSELTYSFNQDGFYITDNKNDVLFKSKSFLQSVTDLQGNRLVRCYDSKLIKNWNVKMYKVVFIDLDSGIEFVCSHPIGGQYDIFPTKMSITERALAKEEYGYITIPLTAVLKASVETGNPVAWC